MDSNPSTPSADQVVKTAPILVLGLLMGLISYAGLGAFMRTQNQPAPGGPPTNATAPVDDQYLLLGMGGMLLIAVPAQFILAKLAVGRAKAAAEEFKTEQDKRGAIAAVFMVTTVTRAAFAEGAGLLGAMIVFLTGNLLGLVGVAISAVLLVLLLPARSRFDRLCRDATETRFGM
jgi:hypothetical protein